MKQKSWLEEIMVRLTPYGLLIFASFFLGCSLFSKRQPIGEDKQSASEEATVSKAQYDLLLQKYEALVKEKRRNNEMAESGEEQESGNELNQGQEVAESDKSENSAESEDEGHNLENRHHQKFANAGSEDKPELSETVNVLTGDTGAGEEAGHETMVSRGSSRAERAELPNHAIQIREEETLKNFQYNEEKLQEDIDSLGNAKRLSRKGSYLEAMNLLKRLEKSSFKQIQVRAKFSLGEIFMKQNEYDLSMQTFEDILQNYAFSGVVLKALSQLVICSDKLKLEKKHLQYSSLLKDVFQEG